MKTCKNLLVNRKIFLSVLFLLGVSLQGTFAYAQWTAVNVPSVSESWELLRVHFSSYHDGWAVGRDLENRQGVLLHYSGGAWTSVVPSDGVLDNRFLYGVHFTSSDEGWAVGWETWSNHRIILHYTGGAWTAVDVPHVHATVLYGVHFTSADEGWAVGVDWYQKGIIAHYTGGTWATSPVPFVSNDWYLWNVYFPSPDEGWAVGWDNENGNGVLLHYSGWAGGWGWSVVTQPAPSGHLHGVHFTSPDEGWVVGGGTVFHYTNGNWVAADPYGTMHGVYFPTPNEGWAVGGNGGDGWVIHYSNGQWQFDTVPDLNTSWELFDVCFPSGGQGWAVGVDSVGPTGVILRYSLLEVTSPEKEDKWQRGKTYPIRWTYSGTPGASVKIDLYKGGFKDSMIAEGVSIGDGGNGSYHWKIPSKKDTGSDYQVRVTVEGNDLYTDISPRFTIVKTLVGPSIVLESPDGGESWKAGTARTIKWEYSGNCGSKVKIELLKDGTLDSVIADNVSIGIGSILGGEGTFTWNIPATQDPGSKYKIRVTSKTKKNCSGASTKNFRITNSALLPLITVISPNGGEHWQANTEHTIQWTLTGTPGLMKIELVKGGMVQGTIATDVVTGKDGKGQHTWLIPSAQATGSDYRIRITSLSNGLWSDTSNDDFVINPNTKGPTITVTTPNGGENWQADTTQVIQWTYTGNPGSTVKIDAYRITGTALAHFPIVASTPVGSGGSGSYSWKIPADQPAGSDYKIAVTSTANSSYTDMSNNNFTITTGTLTPTITVTSANGGETMQAGWTGYLLPNIQWKYTGNPGPNVKIELLKGGVLDSVIAASVAVGSGGSGSYYWDIPVSQAAGTDYRIRITSTSNGAYTDTSDGNFTITAAPTITLMSPNGKEVWQSGSTYAITWTYGGTLFSSPFNSIVIELLQGGMLYSTIATDVPVTDGSYSWTIPGGQVFGSDYRVRLTYKFYNKISDASNGNFMIAGCSSPPGIMVVSPNGGESWLRGTTHTIQWSYVGCPGTNVKIELTYYPAVALPTTSTIVSSTPIGTGGSGSYSWAIPASKPAGHYKVRVTSDLGYSDSSNELFMISALIIGDVY